MSVTAIYISGVPFVLMGFFLITTAYYGQCKQRVRASPSSKDLPVLLDIGKEGVERKAHNLQAEGCEMSH